MKDEKTIFERLVWQTLCKYKLYFFVFELTKKLTLKQLKQNTHLVSNFPSVSKLAPDNNIFSRISLGRDKSFSGPTFSDNLNSNLAATALTVAF